MVLRCHASKSPLRNLFALPCHELKGRSRAMVHMTGVEEYKKQAQIRNDRVSLRTGRTGTKETGGRITQHDRNRANTNTNTNTKQMEATWTGF